MLAASREIRKEYKVFCPVCGKFQYKVEEGSGNTTFTCCKCNTEKKVIIFEGCMVFANPDPVNE